MIRRVKILSLAIDVCGLSASPFEWNSGTRELVPMDIRLPPKDVKGAIAKSPGALTNLIGDYAREVRAFLPREQIDALAVSAPGTIDTGRGMFLKSTRL